MITSMVAQGSDEWKKLRLGIPTASSFDEILTSKGEPSKQATAYVYRLAGERISGQGEEGYSNAAMLRGIELEPEAIGAYELIKNVTVERVGFCYEDGLFGCSPDGFVGEDGMIQIKCPEMATHMGYLIEKKLPTKYFQQVQGELYVTNRKWSDFISYYPGLPTLIVRVERDEQFINLLHQALKKFVAQVVETVEITKKMADQCRV
jgi:hypothetical protein